MRNHIQTRTRFRSLLRVCGAAMLAVAALVASERFAAAQSASGPASIGRMRLSFSIVPAPLGSIETSLGQNASTDTAVAFGLRPAFDYSINKYLFVGFGPQFLFNVKADSGGDAGKAVDLLLRVGGHAPVADNVQLYGYLAPGYSIYYPPTGNEDPSGFVLGVAVGALFSINERLFASADIGYQLGYQEATVFGADIDVHLRYLLIGLGIGMKL